VDGPSGDVEAPIEAADSPENGEGSSGEQVPSQEEPAPTAEDDKPEEKAQPATAEDTQNAEIPEKTDAPAEPEQTIDEESASPDDDTVLENADPSDSPGVPDIGGDSSDDQVVIVVDVGGDATPSDGPIVVVEVNPDADTPAETADADNSDVVNDTGKHRQFHTKLTSAH